MVFSLIGSPATSAKEVINKNTNMLNTMDKIEALLENEKFVKFLEDEFMKTDYGMMSLDDDLPDNFEYWLSGLLDVQVLEFAEKFERIDFTKSLLK